MRWPRTLLPYALASGLVVASSMAALTLTLPGADAGGAAPDAPTTPAAPRISEAGGLAFWRAGDGGDLELRVGDLEGSRRWPLARAGSDRDSGPSLTRWSPAGDAVAYVEGGRTLVVVRLDGKRVALPIDGIPGETRRRIRSYQWSPSGTSIAASIEFGIGRSAPTNVFVARVEAGGGWRRVTTLGDVLAGPWISEDELFFETRRGVIGILELPGVDRLRPITGMAAVSPIVGPDGRVYFIGSRGAGDELAGGPYGWGEVWSMTLGGEPRRETKARYDMARVSGFWPDGRFVIATPGGAYLLGDEIGTLPWTVGTIRRIAVSPDGSAAYGLTDSRVLRLDPGRMRNAFAAEGVTLLMDGVRDADVWFPTSARVPLRDAAAAGGERPAALYAFELGGHVWTMSADGQDPRLAIAQTQTGLGWISQPRWSPDGERFVTLAGEPTSAGPSYYIVIADREGERVRIGPHRLNDTPVWSPDGSLLAAAVHPDTGVDWWRDPDAWRVRAFRADGSPSGDPTPGQGVAWVEGGMAVLDAGRPTTNDNVRTDHVVRLLPGGRSLLDAGLVAAEASSRGLPQPELPLAIASIAASADGRYLSSFLHRVGVGGQVGRLFVMVRVSDGALTFFLAPDGRASEIGDPEWAPRGALLAHAAYTPAPSFTTTPEANTMVRDADGRIVFEVAGQFAGWAPDGEWVYTSAPEGLFAHRLDGSLSVRVSPFGRRVSTTLP